MLAGFEIGTTIFCLWMGVQGFAGCAQNLFFLDFAPQGASVRLYNMSEESWRFNNCESPECLFV